MVAHLYVQKSSVCVQWWCHTHTRIVWWERESERETWQIWILPSLSLTHTDTFTFYLLWKISMRTTWLSLSSQNRHDLRTILHHKIYKMRERERESVGKRDFEHIFSFILLLHSWKQINTKYRRYIRESMDNMEIFGQFINFEEETRTTPHFMYTKETRIYRGIIMIWHGCFIQKIVQDL